MGAWVGLSIMTQCVPGEQLPSNSCQLCDADLSGIHKATIIFIYLFFLAVALFTLVGFIQMTIWAKGKHKTYIREFKDYPNLRMPILPFILWHSYIPTSGQNHSRDIMILAERTMTHLNSCMEMKLISDTLWAGLWKLNPLFKNISRLSCKMMSHIVVGTMVCYLGFEISRFVGICVDAIYLCGLNHYNSHPCAIYRTLSL